MFTVVAGDNSTELGVVGQSKTILGAKRIGRKSVREALPNGQGGYRVRDTDGREVLRAEKSIRTSNQWCESD
jgi:hypothetical protein